MARILIIMIHGAQNTPQQFVDHEFISTLNKNCTSADVLLLDISVDSYLNYADVEQKLDLKIDEAKTEGYQQIWLLGISLGATAVMLCATKRESDITGIFLLAPYLGSRGFRADVVSKGGLKLWNDKLPDDNEYEHALLLRIKSSKFITQYHPRCYIAWGDKDRYRNTSMLLSQFSLPQNVAVVAGDHDWLTWKLLWKSILRKDPFKI